ncbi:hypothetical protein [Legionella busanensis]|uniref:hypothetical protein n=1 Tax=Legionella busanensis TaxID=190655 RepID=UPI001041BA29|nr:hypothetical protein [Legionella busanensis]
MQHENRFNHPNQLSLQSTIDKKLQMESHNLSKIMNSKMKTEEQEIKRERVEINKELLKELDL